MVFRLLLSNVRILRSQKITLEFPPERTCFADSSHSSIVAETPRLSSTDVSPFPRSLSNL